jgi:hypothetical protein
MSVYYGWASQKTSFGYGYGHCSYWSPGRLNHAPGWGHLSWPCRQWLLLQCPSMVTAVIVYKIRREGHPHHQVPAMGIATHHNQTCTSLPHLGYGEAQVTAFLLHAALGF